MKTKRFLIPVAVFLFLLILLIFPDTCLEGAKTGLLLWFNTVLPTLLPFIILSNLIIHLNYTKFLCRICSPIIRKIFKVSSQGCYPIIMGLLSGYPLGAKSCADMVVDNRISKKEGQYLLSLCNNASIMFITGYIALSSLHLDKLKLPILIIIYISSILSSILIHPKKEDLTLNNGAFIDNTTKRFKFSYLDDSILDGFIVMTKVGGYIILFSILAFVVKDCFSENIFSFLTIGFFEITTGIFVMSDATLSIALKIVLITTITAFGGLSSLFQTNSVLGNSGLSIRTYFLIKLLNAFIAFVLSLLYVRFIF